MTKRPALDPTGVLPEAPLTYESYLRVPELCALQTPRAVPPCHDEIFFIVIHQSYELWFRAVLHELERAIATMRAGEVLQARQVVERVVQIFNLLVQQIHLLETMAPVDFLAFRAGLTPASGLHSAQFREVECLCGLKDPDVLRHFDHLPASRARVAARLEGPDLRHAFYDLLRARGFAIPADIGGVPPALIEAVRVIYQTPEDHMPLNLLAESLVSLDQGLTLWRTHHMHVVQRIIGHKRGTGGSAGARYLRQTTDRRCFPCLWEVRTVLVARS